MGNICDKIGKNTGELVVNYEVSNGLLGMRRDVVIRLCSLFGQFPQKIRAVFGICEKQATWKNSQYFLNSRKPYSLPSFRLTGCKDEITFRRDAAGMKCIFMLSHTHCCQTVFADRLIDKGVWRWNVQIENVEDNNHISILNFGAFPFDTFFKKKYICNTFTEPLHDGRGEIRGSCSLHITRDTRSGELLSWLLGIEESFGSLERETPIPNISLVSMEADATAHTLSFSVNKKRVRRCVARVLFPLLFGMSGLYAESFTWVSLCRLSTPTPSSGSSFSKLYICKSGI